MPRCPYCDQDNPPGVVSCEQCGTTLPREPEAELASAHSGELEGELRALLAAGDKIGAIRRFREATGAGLAAAKEAVEALADGPAPGGLPGVAGLEEGLLARLRTGDKIGAIKHYREMTGAGLREAKEAVEAFARQNGLPVRGGGCVLLLAALALGAGVSLAAR